jgi:hypothetical protein
VKVPVRVQHPLDLVKGAGDGLVAAARIAYLFGPNPVDEDERVLTAAKCNIGPRPPSLRFELDVEEFDDGVDAGLLVYRGETTVTADDLIASGQKGRPRPEKRSRAAEWLARYLWAGDGARPVKEIQEDARHHGFSWRTVRRAADELGIAKPKGGPSSVWRLPAELKGLLDEQEGDA